MTADALALPDPSVFEPVRCYSCGSAVAREFLVAEDDLTGKPGRFRFVVCVECGLAYQNPRITLQHIQAYYDDEYLAHRAKRDWGLLQPLFDRSMDALDRRKLRIVRRYIALDAASEVLDVGCGAGTFLAQARSCFGARVAGVDFKDLSHRPEFAETEFHWGLFYEQAIGAARFDLVTMWHFLEHDYDPLRSLRTARRVLKPDGRLVIEVPRLDSLTYRVFGRRWPGLQAPQHTVLFSRATLFRCVTAAGLDVVDYLPYGAFPAYFYLFAGAAFTLLRGRGLDLSKAIYPYFTSSVSSRSHWCSCSSGASTSRCRP